MPRYLEISVLVNFSLSWSQVFCKLYTLNLVAFSTNKVMMVFPRKLISFLPLAEIKLLNAPVLE